MMRTSSDFFDSDGKFFLCANSPSWSSWYSDAIFILSFLSFIFSHDTFDLKKSFLQNLYFASYYLDQDRNKNNKNNSQPRNSPYTGASLVYGCSIYCHFANKHFEWSVRCGQKVTTASFLNKSNPVAISYIPLVFLDKCSSRNDGRKKSKVLLFGLQTSSHNR